MARFEPGFIKPGMKFIHAQRGVECRITAVTRDHIVYRIFGMAEPVRVAKRNFKVDKVERWL